jgi:hypothetical protein
LPFFDSGKSDYFGFGDVKLLSELLGWNLEFGFD